MREIKLLKIVRRALKKAVLLSVVTLVMPGMAAAAQINGISLMDSDAGDVLRIETDAALEYQVFDLDGPPRMVINFPEASVSSDIVAIKPGGEGVTGVFPTKSADGVRLEVGLSEMVGYKIEESGNALVIRFEKTGSESVGATVAAVIKDIEVRDRGDVTELILRGDNMDASYNAFLTNNNKILIFDFWDGESKLPRENYKYATQRIKNVTIGEAEGRVRLVIGVLSGGELSQQIDAEKGKLTIRLGSVAPKRRASSVVVESVNFQPDDRIAHLIVRTDVVNPILSITEKDGNVIIDVKKAALANGQERSQDVSAFPGPVKQVDSYVVDDMVRIVARLRDKVDISSYQQGNVFTVNLEPEDIRLARRGVTGKEEFAYSGQKVTFDFKDIDIRNALKLISEMSDLNIIMSDDVAGTLTMRLIDVPWDQALDLILAARGLGQEKIGNVVRIAPVEVLRSEYESKLQARRGAEKLEPLVTAFITLSFTKVVDVKKMLDGASANATKGGGKKAATKAGAGGSSVGKSVGILSPRGSFLVDKRTNTLIVKDTESAVNSVKRLMARIDKPVRQVLIESRIVEAKDSFTRDLGVRWGGQYTDNTGVAFPDQVKVGGAGSGAAIGNSLTLVDLPAAGAILSGGAIGLSLGSVASAINLDLELSASEADDDIKIISNPRIITTNLKPAFIKQGVKVGIVTPGSANNPPSTVLVDALLELKVTPQITANDGVIMDVVVTKNTPTTFNSETGIDSKEISTNVYMKSGETVVIGGIYTRNKTESEAGVPGFKNIPVLGWLFKKRTNIDNKTELLIFLTPTIVKGDIDIQPVM